ncbi:MAG: OmpA family protein, partial [Deltaproteobacteria bacterium]
SARAGGLDASGYRPALSSTGFFARDGGAVLAPGAVEIALSLDAADDLLVVRDPRTGAVWPDGGRLVDARLTGTLGIAVGLFGRVELGAQMPVVLAQDGAVQRVRARGDLASTAAGDLRVGGKLRLLGSDALALSLAVDAAAPTGSADGFAGGSIAVTSRVVVGGRVGRFAFGVDVGYRARERAVVGDLAVDDEIVGGAATAVAVVRGRAWLVAEANAAVAAGGGGDTLRPVEVLAGVRWRPRGPWLVQAGVGAGVTEGYGAPRARGVIALRYAPVPRPAAGPRAPVRVVRRPTPPPAPKPPVDSDGDGVSDADDRCPLAPEDRDGFEDEDGCPDNDNDGDGIADRDDRCPLEREVVNGVDDTDGCPDEGLIELVEDRIVLPNRVLFDTDRARVKHSGKKVLRAIVELWRQHPEWDRMLVQGHTDERGDADYNLWLSQRRAERVVRELVKLGVDPAKLEAQGFGETKPVAHGDSEEALQKNRRVEFVIIERRPPDAPGTGESGSGDGAGDAPAGGPRPVSPPGLQGS